MTKANKKTKAVMSEEFPLLGFTLFLYKEGQGKSKRIVLGKETSADQSLEILLDKGMTTAHHEELLHEYRRLARKYSAEEAEAQRTGGVKVKQKKKKLPGPDKKAPGKLRVVNVRTPQTEALIETLQKFGYSVIPSPQMEKGSGGCYRCVFDGVNRANILPCSDGVRVGFLPGGAFLQKDGTAAIVAMSKDPAYPRWKMTGEKDGRYKVVAYHGPIAPELLRAFGVDPDGPNPETVTMHSIAVAASPKRKDHKHIKAENHDTAVVKMGRRKLL